METLICWPNAEAVIPSKATTTEAGTHTPRQLLEKFIVTPGENI
jgi:hypothetical protein